MKNWFILVFIALGLTTCTMSDDTHFAASNSKNMNKYRTYKWIPKDSTTISNVLYDNSFLKNSIIDNSNRILINKGYYQSKDSADLLIEYRFMVENKEELINNQSITNLPQAGPKTYIQPFSPYTPTSSYNGIGPYPGNYDAHDIYAPYDSPQSLYYYNNPGNVYNPGYYANNYPYYTPYGFPNGGTNVITNNVQKFNFKEGTLIIDIIDSKTGELVWRGWNVEGLSDPSTYQKNVPSVIQEILSELPTNSGTSKKSNS